MKTGARKMFRIELTASELDIVLHCIGEFTNGNARDVDEMMLCGLSRKETRTLLRAERKLTKSRDKTLPTAEDVRGILAKHDGD